MYQNQLSTHNWVEFFLTKNLGLHLEINDLVGDEGFEPPTFSV
jgi:hypothetical protein